MKRIWIKVLMVAAVACSLESDPLESTDAGGAVDSAEGGEAGAEAGEAGGDASEEDGGDCIPSGVKVDSADCDKCCHWCAGLNDNVQCSGPI